MATSLRAPDLHGQEVQETSVLCRQQIMNSIAVEEVLSVLNAEGIRYVLAGAYGLAGWRQEARATQDVDLVIMAKHQKKATKALTAAFPFLEIDDQEVVTRLRNRETQKVAIDLIKTMQPLYKAVFKHVKEIQVEGEPCLIPSLEMALAMKFAPMVSLTREDFKKFQDAGDFIRMARFNPDIDLDTLAELGDLVYPGGGKELVQKVEDVRAGRKLTL